MATLLTIRHACCTLLVVFLSFGCSNPDPVQPEATPPATADATPSTVAVDESTTAEVSPVAAATATPTLADENLASVVDLAAGAQVEDEQGNLLAIYGFAEWPEPFGALSDQAQAAFPFFGDVSALGDSGTELVVLDIGICSAGIDASAFGTAEFFVHERPDDVLSTDAVLDRGMLARHPVVQPGFDFPASAECARGWLPVLWSGSEPPSTARYVLTTRASAAADVERHVYQWDIEGEAIAAPADSAADSIEQFGIGQTVTFNDGRLAETTVVVSGWTELVGADAGTDGTRLVAVSLNFCPKTLVMPEFGLAIDGWNLVAPRPGSDLLGALAAGDPTLNCFDGWLEFVVPFGGVPTAFFASDGVNPTSGYAEWSLEGAALAPPQS